MTEVESLRIERETKHVIYVQFLAEYKKNRIENCYGFVEGKDDPSYYQSLINKELPSKYKIRLFPSGNKKAVKDVYECFDWRRFSKDRIVFFIDKDLCDFIDDSNIIHDRNVYLTEKYSIENDIANLDSLEAVLREVMGFVSLEQELMDKILHLFECQKEVFEKIMKPVMANIIHWKRLSLSVCNYKKINIKDFVKITNGEISLLKNGEEILNYIYERSEVDIAVYDKTIVSDIQNEITIGDKYKSIVRGKFITTFFISFCNSIYTDFISLGLTRKNTGMTLGELDMMRIVAPRCRLPISLKSFIDSTLLNYISTNVA